MIIEVLRENLKRGLQTVERIAGKNTLLPILNNVYIKTEKNYLNLITTDLETAIKYKVLAKVEKEGEITIPVRLFLNFLSFIDEQKIKIDLEDKKIVLQGENYKTEIKGLDPKDFPIIPEIEKKAWVEVNPSPLSEGISQVIDFTSTTQIRPELAGIYFKFSKKEAKIVATDSFRLAEKTFYYQNEQDNIDEEQVFILPRNAAREIMNIFSDYQGKVKIYFSKNQVLVESYFSETDNPQIQLISRLIEGDFPNYEEIIPKESKTRVFVDKNQFVNYLKAASIFSGKGNEINIKIDPKDSQIEIITENTDVGSTQFVIPSKIEGEKTKICFNYKFLLDGISKISGSEIFIGLNGEEGPAIMKSPDDPSFIYILMPIKSS